MSVDHGDFGRSAIMRVYHGHKVDPKYYGNYIGVKDGITMTTNHGLVNWKLIASRTKPHTKYVRQHLFHSKSHKKYMVVEVNNRGYDDE